MYEIFITMEKVNIVMHFIYISVITNRTYYVIFTSLMYIIFKFAIYIYIYIGWFEFTRTDL